MQGFKVRCIHPHTEGFLRILLYRSFSNFVWLALSITLITTNLLLQIQQTEDACAT
jgi:hypothetical protein